MPRIKLTLEYAGTRYSGWQIQKNARTVQGELNRAIGEVLRTPRFETYGSGRTDAGVHALYQVAHLDAATTPPPETLVAQVNDALPHDINVLGAERVPPRFHARHSASARSYLYQIATRRTAFAKPFVWWVKDDLDLDRMRAGASALAGFRDFRAFTDDDPGEKSTQVFVEEIVVVAAWRADPGARRRIALSLEDGPPDRRRPRRSRSRRARPGRRHSTARRLVRRAGTSDRASVRTVSRACLLRR